MVSRDIILFTEDFHTQASQVSINIYIDIDVTFSPVYYVE